MKLTYKREGGGKAILNRPRTAKNVGRFPAKAGHDPFPQLMVPEYAHILT